MTATFGRVEVPKRMLKLRRDERGYPVPVVAEWSSEQELQLPPPVDPQFGAIAVTRGEPGVGTAMLGNMEPTRQRHAMLATRCQVCDRDLRSSKFRFMAGGPMLDWFTEPWVCGPCMAFAVRVCPGLIRATRHTLPLVIHRVRSVELCQERIGLKPPSVTPIAEFKSDLDAHAMDAAMKERRSWLAPMDFRPQPAEQTGLRYTSMLYFIRARVTESQQFTTAEFLAAFDWSGA